MTMASTTPLRFIVINIFILAMMTTNRRPLIRHAEAAFSINHHQLPYRHCQYHNHRCHRGRSQMLFPFQRSTTRNNIHHHHQRLSSSSKEDEIAALEEKLAQLKKESAAEAAEEETTTTTPIATTTTTTAAAVVADDDTIIKSQPYEEMLTEKWKESLNSDDGSGGDGGSSIGGTVIKIVGGLALLVALSAFSQVPVGQENLDKYSTAKPSTTIDLGDLNRSKKSEFEI